MVHVVKIQVWINVDITPETTDTRHIDFTPTSQDIEDIKLDIARAVKETVESSPEKVNYYYVVLKTRSARPTADKRGKVGKFGYRTIVPKIML